MRYTSGTLVLLGLAVFCLVAGPGCDRTGRYVEWERTYAGPDLVEPVAIVRSPDSGYVVLANITDRWTRAEGVWLLRLDDGGETLWTRSFIIGAETRADDIVAASDGWILVSGRTDLPDSGSTPFLAQITSWGNVWHPCTFQNLRGIWPCLMAGAPDSSVVMAGGSGSKTAFVQRTTYTGYAYWDTNCSLPGEFPALADLRRTDNDSYFLCGRSFGIGLSESRGVLWVRDYSNLGSVEFRAADAASDGGFFLAGCVYTETGSRIICARIDSAGDLQWSRRVDDPPASGCSVCGGSDGTCYVVGRTNETDSDDGIVVKFDATGGIEWQREFNGPGYGAMVSATRAPDGDIVVLGSANQELRLLKLEP
jgi:hypothetical protein